MGFIDDLSNSMWVLCINNAKLSQYVRPDLAILQVECRSIGEYRYCYQFYDAKSLDDKSPVSQKILEPYKATEEMPNRFD